MILGPPNQFPSSSNVTWTALQECFICEQQIVTHSFFDIILKGLQPEVARVPS
jgi:hypothetical protein